MKPSKRNKEKPYEDKYYKTRRAAFRAAKRDNGIPVSRQPQEVIRPNDEKWVDYNLDREKNRALYRFIVYLLNMLTGFFERREVRIREDTDYSYGAIDGTGDQEDHFNSGEVNAKRTKLKRHHYFSKRNKK